MKRSNYIRRRINRLEQHLAGDPDDPGPLVNIAAISRGLRDLHRWIASEYLLAPEDPPQPGLLSRRVMMCESARELMAAGVLGPLLEQGHDEPLTLSPEQMIGALQAGWLGEPELPPPLLDFGRDGWSPKECALADRFEALRAHVASEDLPPAWNRLREELTRYAEETSTGWRITGPPWPEQPDPTFI